MTYTCPGIAMPKTLDEPYEGYVACYRAGHVCPPAVTIRTESHGQVTTTLRCPCCGEFYGAMTAPVERWTL